MKALILAAGIGKRLRPITNNIPKCLIQVGEKTIIEHLLDNFSYAGIKEVIIVVGFNKEAVQKKIRNFYKGMEIKYAINNLFDTTNNLYSLWCAKDFIDGAFIQCHGDIIFNKEIIKKVIESPIKDAVIVDSDPDNFVEDANRINVQDGRVIEINKIISKEESSGRAFGLYKFSEEGAKNYYRHIENNLHDLNVGFEIGLNLLIKEMSFQIIDINNFPYIEIDNLADLELAKKRIKEVLGDENDKY